MRVLEHSFDIAIDSSFLQCVGVLKLMVENAQAQDEVLTVDMTPILYSLATFINSFNNLPAYRIRLKFCGLCDSVFSRPDMLRKDSTSSHRQKILDILLGWIQDPILVCSTVDHWHKKILTLIHF